MSDHESDAQRWLPKASLKTLRQRAVVYRWIRGFFDERSVLEVNTPVLSHCGTTDRHIESFRTQFHGVDGASPQALYLITSPEFHMKRLLAAGSGDIYQLSRVFRQSELGSQHNPEFTLLEWYRVGQDHHQLMEEVAELINGILVDCAFVECSNNKALQYECLSYREVFKQHLGIDPITESTAGLRVCAQQHGFVIPAETQGANSNDLYLDFLMSHVVQPRLGEGCLSFVYGYPASQCSLARLSDADKRVAERFELFYQGVELANGFHELVDAVQQQERFELDNTMRLAVKQKPVTMDHHLITALESGLPPCAGVAVGIDRLLQLIQQEQQLDAVLAFPFDRA